LHPYNIPSDTDSREPWENKWMSTQVKEQWMAKRKHKLDRGDKPQDYAQKEF
jgi:hypothetical protein